MQPIQTVSVATLPPLAARTPNCLPAGSVAARSFEDVLANSLEQLNAARQQAPRAAGNFSTGAGASPPAVFTAIDEAGSVFRTAMQVGDRLVAAYDEIKDLRM